MNQHFNFHKDKNELQVLKETQGNQENIQESNLEAFDSSFEVDINDFMDTIDNTTQVEGKPTSPPTNTFKHFIPSTIKSIVLTQVTNLKCFKLVSTALK